MSNPYLLMWLEAPLQSWGYDSKFGRRETLNFPTKSGVFGLLCCALGAGGEQRELLARLAPMPMLAISFTRTKKSNELTSVKCDREPLLKDFHMIGSGYNGKDPWEKLLTPKTNDGKKANGGGTKITYRYYLQDAAFAVILELPHGEAEIFATALQNPVWDLYLGRKNCVPTDFIFRGLFATIEEADAHSSLICQGKKLQEDFRVISGEDQNGEVLILNDVPVQFGEHKQYRDRYVTVIQA